MQKQTIRLCVLMGGVSLLLNSCGGVDQQRAMEMANSLQLAASPAADLNRDLALGANLSPAKPQDYEIGPEDVLDITLFNIDQKEDGMPGNVQSRVSQTGFVTLPILGEVQVSGLTPSQLEQTLREKYGEYMHAPDVGVRVTEYQSHSVSVLGAVKKPGVFQVTGSTKLRDLLAMAGGVTDEAGTFLHVSQQRAEGAQTSVINLYDLSKNVNGALNLPIHSGDVITVPRAGSFFVDGYVGNPGAYPLSREYTLSQALAVAGGVTTDAKPSEITVFRRNEQGEVQTIILDLGQIRELQAKDITIAENDVIVVPPNTVKMVLTTMLDAVSFAFTPAPFRVGVGGVRGGRVR